MKKNIDWLRREIHKELESWCGVEGGIDGDGINEIMLLINQLGTEVLSQEWLDEHSNGASRSRYVWVNDLKDLLVPKQDEREQLEIAYKDILNRGEFWFDGKQYKVVPKQEESAPPAPFDIHRQMLEKHGYVVIEKPTIPQFVANYIPLAKLEIDLKKVAYYATTNNELPRWKKEYDWIRANFEVFVRAWLAYPNIEVEEEEKYIVVLGKSIYNTTTYGQIGEVNSKKIMQSVYANEENIITPNQYTKSEILEVKDGEDIFKRYAVKVEELEE